jgi:hypothetical protein
MQRGVFVPRWGPLFPNLKGHDDGLSMQFALNFDGKKTRVGSLSFEFSKSPLLQLQRSQEWEIDGSKTTNRRA